jgi:hypothetical protein
VTVWLVGNGIVGRRIARMLPTLDVHVHDPRREPTPIAHPGDVAVLAHPVEHAPLARGFGLRGASVVTVGDDYDDAVALLDLADDFTESGATLVVGAAMSPGLSGLLTRHLADQLATLDEIHVAIHGTAGPACARTYHRSLSRRSHGWHDDAWIDYLGGSGRELCWFPEPVGAKDCYRADFADPLLLHTAFPHAHRISARRSARRTRPVHGTPADAERTARRGPDRRLARGGARRRRHGWARVPGGRCRRARGHRHRGHGCGVHHTMALEGGLPAGCVVAGEGRLPTRELLSRVESFGVRLQEFTGVPQGT